MISKEDLKKILIEWEERELPEIIKREIKINYTPKQITTITGIRRSGKTFLLFWIAKGLLEKFTKQEILYINFEHELLNRIDAKDIRKIFEIHTELYSKNKKIKYLLFDEIQKVQDWPIILRRLHDERKYFIFVTGSTSEMTPKKVSYSLRGRTVNYTIFPLSFKEFLRFKNYKIDKRKLILEIEKGELLKLLSEYLKFGGFPDIVLEEKPLQKQKLISSYFDTILLRDIIEKHNIRNIRTLEFFIKYLISIASSYFSATKTENYFKSIGEKCHKSTILDFFRYIEESFLIFKLEIFSPKIKERKQYPVKVYCIDNAFINFVNPRFSENTGRLMENVVAVELFRRMENNQHLEIYYFKDYQQKEVDFVVKEGWEVKQLIQVTYASSINEIEKREIKALLKASELLKCNNLLVITWDLEEEEKVERNRIKYIPLWKWLIEGKESKE